VLSLPDIHETASTIPFSLTGRVIGRTFHPVPAFLHPCRSATACEAPQAPGRWLNIVSNEPEGGHDSTAAFKRLHLTIGATADTSRLIPAREAETQLIEETIVGPRGFALRLEQRPAS
jgi:hypothetical protein